MCKSDNKENPVTSSSSLPSINTVEHELKHRNTKIEDWSQEIDHNQFVESELAVLEPTVSSSPASLKQIVSSSSPAVSQQQQSRGNRGQSYRPRRSFRNSRGSDRGYPRGGGRGWNPNPRGPIPPVAHPDPGKTFQLLTKDGRDHKVTILPASSNDVRFDPHYRSTYNQNIPRIVSNVQKSNTDVQNVQLNDVQMVPAADVQNVPATDGHKVQGIDNPKDQKAVKENDQRRHDFSNGKRSKRSNRSPRSNFNNQSRLSHTSPSGFRPPATPLQQSRTYADRNRRNNGNQSIPRTKSEHAFTESNNSQNLSQTTTKGQELKPAVPKPNVFGEAKPVDTHVKLMEIEQKKLKEKEERNKKRNGMNESSKKVSPDTNGVPDPDKVDKEVGDQPSKTSADAIATTDVPSVDGFSAVNLSEIPSFQPKSNIAASTAKPFKNRYPKHFNQSYPGMMPVAQYYQPIPHPFQPFGFQAPAHYFGQLEHPQFPPMPQMIYQPHQFPQQLPTYQVPYQQGATAASQQYVPQVHPQYAQQHMQQQYNNGQPIYYTTPPPQFNPNGTSNYGQPQ